MNSSDAKEFVERIAVTWRKSTNLEETTAWMQMLCTHSPAITLTEAELVLKDLIVQTPDRRPSQAMFLSRLKARRPAPVFNETFRCVICDGTGWTPSTASEGSVRCDHQMQDVEPPEPAMAILTAREAVAKIRKTHPQLWRGKKVTL